MSQSINPLEQTLVFFDSETTGLPNKQLPLTSASQPHICQLAAIMTDGDGREKNSINLLIKPEGWIITPELTAIHGVSHEDAMKYGMGLKGAVGIMKKWLDMADIAIGHNIEFDKWMLARSAAHSGYPDNHLVYKQSHCTMESSRDIVKIPPTDKMMSAGIKENKSPKLAEVYKHLYGEALMGAHDAMTDVLGCKRVYFTLQRLRAEQAMGEFGWLIFWDFRRLPLRKT